MTTVVYECNGKTAIKHITYGNSKTICKKNINKMLSYNTDEEKEIHCKRCWRDFADI